MKIPLSKEKLNDIKLLLLNFRERVPCPEILLKINYVIDLRVLLPGLFLFMFLQSSVNSYIENSKEAILSELSNQYHPETVHIERIEISKDTHVENTKKTTEKTVTKSFIINGLTQLTELGNLPIIRRSDSLTSFRAYEKKFDFEPAPNKPFISFLLQDFGVSQSLSEDALDLLPEEVSLLLSPYAALPQEWVNMAKASGHEVWLELPIQNSIELNRGKYTLFHHDPLSEKQEKLRTVLSQAQGYVGLVGSTDQQIETVREHYSEIADEIFLRGLGYIEMNANFSTVFAARSLVGGISAPYLHANMILERVIGPNNDFLKLEKLAQMHGYVLVVVPNYPKVIKQLDIWLEKIAQHDYVLAPVSALYDLPLHRDVVLNHVSTKETSDLGNGHKN